MPTVFSDNLDDFVALRVAAGTPPKELAASIVHLLNEDRRVKLTAIGHQAVGQAVKAVTAVNQYCVAQGYLVTLLPSFSLVTVVNRNPELSDSGEESRTEERTVTNIVLIRISPQ